MSFHLRCWGNVNSTSNLLFTAPAHEVGLALGFLGGFGVWGFWVVGRCGDSCRRRSLRHSLSFRISRAVGTAAALFGLSVFLFTENPLKCFIL